MLARRTSRSSLRLLSAAPLAVAFGFAVLPALAAHAQTAVSPRTMKAVGEVDPRFLSYNVEAVEVTGGRFWAPYKSMGDFKPAGPPSGVGAPGDTRFQYRAPIDLSNPKLRKLASALSPAFVRVSGTWRNSSYFQDNDEPALKTPPAGFQNVLTRAEWKGVVDFSKAVHADIVASVATSAGTRDANGVWKTTQAKAFFDYTRRVGGHIAATEFMNEPTLMQLAGVSEDYGAAEYGRDSKIFGALLHEESPGTLYLGPGSAAEGLPGPTMPVAAKPATPNPAAPNGAAPKRRGHLVPSSELLAATGPIFDGFSYHVYYTRSHRCMGANGMDVNKVLEPEYLDRNLTVEAFYEKLRDQYLPGKPLWLTETGEASCGGDTWASEFVDSFRLLDQLGSLAQRSVKAVMHNTLASSDYGLLDEETLDPRPNYWSAVLWKRLMGTTALDPGLPQTDAMRAYAQCMKGTDGGVSLLVLNIDRDAAATLNLPNGGTRYTLSAPDLLSKTVLLNGRELKLASDGSVPEFQGAAFKSGSVSFAPLTITVLAMPDAGNAACKR